MKLIFLILYLIKSSRYRQGLRYLDTFGFQSRDEINEESWKQIESLSNILQLNRSLLQVRALSFFA